MKIADREDGVVRDGRENPGDESAELRELKKRNRLLEAGERCSAASRRLSESRHPPKMIDPLVLDLAADGVPVTVTCRVRGFSTQAFLKWKK